MQRPCEESEPDAFQEWKVTGAAEQTAGVEKGGRGECRAQGGMVVRGQSTHGS